MVALLTRNFHVHSLEHEAEWKHGPVRMPNRTWNGVPARFILCVKNPYAWVVSCYRYFQRSWQCDPTVAPQFQQNPSMPFDQFLRSPSYGFESPIHRWNQMHRLWLATLPTARTQVVRQEDQPTQSREVLYRIERHLELQRLGADLRVIQERIDVNARPSGPMNCDYYLNHDYIAAYSDNDLRLMDKILDRDVLGHLGYL